MDYTHTAARERRRITLWMAGAIYYDIGRLSKWSAWLAVGWVVGVIVVFALWQPLWEPFVGLVGVLVVFLGWWFRLKPSHQREWDPSVALLPRAVQEGDAITIENVRNFEYRSLLDFTLCYETRTFHLGNLKAADIIFFNWGAPCMSHPVLVFDFGPDGRVCGSIEVRYRKGQKFSTLRSFYRQQELIFLVADERDAILRRTKYSRNQHAHLYRFNAGLDELRTVFLDYIGAINSLYARPSLVPRPERELYHEFLSATQFSAASRLACARQRPSGQGALRGRPARPHAAFP